MKSNVFLRVFLVLISLVIGITAANAQIITTYAGHDSIGYGGNGGPATAAELNHPLSVVVDTAGNVYISDRWNNCIRKVTPSGTISTFAGNDTAGYTGNGGPATAARLNSPGTMGIDGYGNIYVSDMGNNVIREIATNDTIYTIAGTAGVYGFRGDGGPAYNALFRKPSIAVDPFGNIYIADQGNYRVRQINTSGIITTIAGTGVAGYSGDGGLAITAETDPINIGVDLSGNVYYTDSVSSAYRVIRKINTSGTINLFLNYWAENLAFDPYGNVYFSDAACYVMRETLYGTLTAYAGNGRCSSSGDGGPATAAGLAAPMGIAFDADLNLYVADYNGSGIRKITYAPTTGVNNVSGNDEKVSVYPNPTSEAFTVELLSANGKVSIIVSDILGKVVANRNVNASNGIKEEFDIRNFVPGTYLIRISSGDKIYRDKVSISSN